MTNRGVSFVAGVLSAGFMATSPAAADQAIIHGNGTKQPVVVQNITTGACLGLAEDMVKVGQVWSAGVTCLGEDGKVTGKRVCSHQYVPNPDAKWWSSDNKKVEIRCE